MTLLFNFGLMSLLIVGAHLVRARVRFLQDYCVPSAMLAGFAAFAAGPNGLDWLPFREPSTLETYPGMLVVILFATLFSGARARTVPLSQAIRQAGDTLLYSLASELGQYGLALLFGLFVLGPMFPALNPAFALMLPVGFAGGPGTAAATAGGLQPYSWDDALTVGLTFATFGQLSGVIGGMALINLATRLGWTRFVRTPGALPEELRRGFLPPDRQPHLGRETVSPLTLDPLAWHVALVLSTAMLGYAARDFLKRLWPMYDFPVFALAMIAGVLVQSGLNRIGLGRHVDRQVVTRIGSTASDYLIAFGIAVIKPTVLKAYAVPLALLIVFGIVYSLAFCWFVGRRAFRNFWFERGLFTYGWNTGLVGTAVALLRVVDPQRRSGMLEDFGLAYVFIAIVDVALVVFLPPLVGAGIIFVPSLVLTAAAVVLVLLSSRWIGWFSASPTELRAGEPPRIPTLLDTIEE